MLQCYFGGKEIHRQIRINGNLKKIDKKRVEKYFYSRPIEKPGRCINFKSKQPYKIL